MATFGRKSANWTNWEDEKLLEILIERRTQGPVNFEWSLVQVVLKTKGVDKDVAQIKNHFNYLANKLKA